ncbi:MAG: hypothetical protein H6978_03885 [Gammaproteobacteria bacterium]|nr:hypothetical protein [Gammaproteobacteria bacterium]
MVPPDFSAIDQISMLDVRALNRLYELAHTCDGGILELGPYVGGSTIAIASGNAGRVPHSVIEVGGSYIDHPSIPSTDIIADWHRNLERFGCAGAAELFQGASYRREVRDAALAHCGRIGLFFVDADGHVAPCIRAFSPWFTENCILAIDDYDSPGAPNKQALVKSWVDSQLAQGHLVAEGLLGGTWFGRINGPSGLAALRNVSPYIHDSGHAYMAHFGMVELADYLDDGSRSRLRLFEDGRELGPAHCMHADIRERGEGRFSHWRAAIDSTSCLYFSASDNSDPRSNGLHYEVDLGQGRVSLADM